MEEIKEDSEDFTLNDYQEFAEYWVKEYLKDRGIKGLLNKLRFNKEKKLEPIKSKKYIKILSILSSKDLTTLK